MNKTTFTLLLLSAIGLNANAFAQQQTSDTSTQESPTSLAKPEDDKQQDKQAPANKKDSNKAEDTKQQDKQAAAKKEDSDKTEDAQPQDKQSSAKKEDSGKAEDTKPQSKANKEDNKPTPNLVKEAAQRHTPPWTNDSANINLQQPRLALDEEVAKPYTAEDFTVKPEWERLFASDEHFSTNSGAELYETMCQACHMADGQGAKGVGYFPSFVGNERLRSPDYPIDVVLNGLRGMPHFSHMLTDEQIAGVVNHLRTSFGNQLDGDTNAEDVARVRK